MQRAVIAGVLWGMVGLIVAVGGVWLLAQSVKPAALASSPGTGPAGAGQGAGPGLAAAEPASGMGMAAVEQASEAGLAAAGPGSGSEWAAVEQASGAGMPAAGQEARPEPVGSGTGGSGAEGPQGAASPGSDPGASGAVLPRATHPLADYQPMHVEPVEPILPDPPGAVPEPWQALHETVYAVAAGYPGRISVVAVDLTTGSRYEFRARDPYLPASTFKLPVALCVLEAIDAGELSWDTLITYTEADYEPVGAGAFAQAAFGSKWTVRNLVDRSLISSNNVAVKMLARTLTWDGLLACTTAMGGPVTRTEEGSTPVSAADESAWWLRLWELSQERPELAEELLRPLRRVTYRGRIQAGTPRPELVTHKFGTYAGYDHDGAIVWADRPYVLVVMTYGGGEYAADRAIERIAAAAWDSVMGASAGRRDMQGD